MYGERFLRKDRTLEYYDLQNGVRERQRERHREIEIQRNTDTQRHRELRERPTERDTEFSTHLLQ